jgi:anaerobic C4-dicarboxylate transporter
VNPTALIFVAFCAVVGALLGSVPIGLAVGLGIVLVASVV